MPSNDRDADLAALLAWYGDMGVRDLVGEAPVDWLSRGDAPPGGAFALPDVRPSAPAKAGADTHLPVIPEAEPQARLSGTSWNESNPASRGPGSERGSPSAPIAPSGMTGRAVRQPPAGASPDAAVLAARAAAGEAGTLDELAAVLARFDGCGLKATAKNLCFYRGATQARLILIGEAPGRDEDLQGKPFVGRAGQLLDKMLAAIGLSEAHVHITNIVYWRPPGNRTPTPQEAQVCRPFLERQVELVAPDFALLLGGAAANHIFGVTEGIMRIRGKWRDVTIGSRTLRTIATLHPAYLLRTPAAKRLAWRDLLAVKAALGS
jgi:uracil-DNA glycosylase